MDLNDPRIIGIPARWDTFFESHRMFLEHAYPRLIQLANEVLFRAASVPTPLESVIFRLGKSAMQDFSELWVLVGNGYGSGAMKILREMLEKVSTAGYLTEAPDATQRFMEYSKVTFNQQLQVFPANGISKELREQAAQEAKSYKEVYEIKQCPTCKRHTTPSWTELDSRSLAGKAGYGLDKIAGVVNPISNSTIHANYFELDLRTKSLGEGRYDFSSDDEYLIPIAVSYGIRLLLITLKIQDSFFRLQKEKAIRDCEALINKTIPGFGDVNK